MWVTASIYSSVIGWAYAIGVLFSLMQDTSFQDALAVARFRRKVNRIREPFVVVAGYGRAGRQLCHNLDALGRHTVVVDSSRKRIDRLAADQLATDVPALEGDIHNPTLLEMAGVLRPNCEAVVALTSDDDANLAVVITSRLLRPGLPVIARCDDRRIAERMRDFEPRAVINPFDLYGERLLLSLRQPTSAQLLTWLMSPPGSPLPERQEQLTDGRWLVCADGPFGEEIAADLRGAGLDVTLVDPADGNPDVSDVVGLVAGAEADTTNLALAAHTRDYNPTVHLVVRQHHHSNAPLVDAFEPDSVFSPNDLVVRESLAWVVTPCSAPSSTTCARRTTTGPAPSSGASSRTVARRPRTARSCVSTPRWPRPSSGGWTGAGPSRSATSRVTRRIATRGSAPCRSSSCVASTARSCRRPRRPSGGVTVWSCWGVSWPWTC